MAKPKIKLDVKGFLLRRGEVLAMGVAGFCLVVLLLWGASKWTSAKDPNDITRDLVSKSNRVTDDIRDKDPSAEDLEAIKPLPFIVKAQINTPAKTDAFPFSGPVFDPTAQPNTKRENPIVFNVTDYQVDLTRSAMPGYDIIYDSNDEPLIAVLVAKPVGELDRKKLQEAAKQLQLQASRGNRRPGGAQPPQPPPPPPGGMPPGGMPPMQPGMPPGGMMPPGMGNNPYGGMGGEYSANSQRDAGKVLSYIPLKQIDEAVAKGSQPAITVIPVRLVTIHAVVPYKQQLEEIKRALRLTTDDEARKWGPMYDGFEIQRRETRVLASGQLVVEQEWLPTPKDAKSTDGNYKFEERYIEKIDTRKIADHFDEGFIPYFLKPEMMLSMPLPLLAKDLNVKYPEIRLKAILDNIKKLEDASKPKVSASEQAKKLQGLRPRNEIYGGRTDSTGSFGIGDVLGGQRGPGGAGMPPGMPPGLPPGMPPGSPPRPGQPIMPEGSGQYSSASALPEIENYLLRFVDSDVKPGRTYEYRVRLRMWNPNFGQTGLVSNPLFATKAYELLHSKWLYLPTPITVPAESFLYAFDTKTYREQTAAAFDGQKELLSRMQIKDNQAVVQMATWTEQVRTDAGTKREPVGAWVVTEIPVGRGEYVGRKQYVKLPLWSSETQQYLLREVTDKVLTTGKGAKELQQPKGWLVDFATKSVLVDFEGGKVKGKFAYSFDDKGNVVQKTRQFEEEAATELLIVRPDGKLVVRSSQADESDLNRKDVSSKWSEWLKLVETRKAPGTGMGTPGEFDPKKP